VIRNSRVESGLHSTSGDRIRFRWGVSMNSNVILVAEDKHAQSNPMESFARTEG
jgi:hypothetical protein